MDLLEGVIKGLGSLGLNILFLIIIGMSLLLMFLQWKKQRRIAELYHTSKKEIEGAEPKKKYNLNYFKSLRRRIEYYYTFNPNKKKADNLYVGILLVELALFISFFVLGKILLAIMFPIVIHWFALKILELASVNIHMFIQKELPIAIKQMIKVMTKTNDLKSIMYETSSTLRDPLRSKFFDLARRMITENHERSLLEFADDMDDTWIYAWVFILISYKEQSKKKDIIRNLAALAEMLENENYQREKAILEKKSVVMLNYALAVIAIVCLGGNFVFNEHAPAFFLDSIVGMIAFVGGVSAILGTFLLNLLLSRKTF